MIKQTQIKKILVLPSAEAAAKKAAEYIAKIIRKNPRAVISFATGNTMFPVFKNLQKINKNGLVNFKKITAFHLDEYYPCSPKKDYSFVKFLNDNLFEPLKIPEKQIFRLDGLAKDPEKEAKRYDELLSSHKINLVTLGIGPGRHLAFNESGSSFKSKTRLINLSQETLLRDHKDRGQDSPSQALTQGIANILEGEKLLLVAYGSEKGKLLKEALFEPISESCPASSLQLVGDKVTIIIDQEAAKELPNI